MWTDNSGPEWEPTQAPSLKDTDLALSDWNTDNNGPEFCLKTVKA